MAAFRSIALFGSTGSIGVNTLHVISRHPDRFVVRCLTTHRRTDLLLEQIEKFHPKTVVVTDPSAKDSLIQSLRDRKISVEVLSGSEGLVEMAKRGDYDIFVGALVGFAGLRSTVEAVRLGKRICIANKESLVVAGEILTALAKRSGSEILPIDSEHSAIYQCLIGESSSAIRRIILTASGGPFRTLPLEEFPSITLERALKHPNWVMGQKITIDSATLMNKGLEVLEAKWLFNQPLSKIDVIVHPQSIIHSLVEFVDGSVKAQLGAPDMRLPIQYALQSPERLDQSYELLDLLSTHPLEFFPPDDQKFPSLRLAREAGERGGLFPCILNAANEEAVHAFLERRIGFTEIPELISVALTSADDSSLIPFSTGSDAELVDGLERIVTCDTETRAFVKNAIETRLSILS